jgi:hypothetical protein
MQGGQDSRVTIPQAQTIADRLGTNGVFHLFPTLGHESYLAAQPEEWRKTVRDFLSVNSSRRAAEPQNPTNN